MIQPGQIQTLKSAMRALKLTDDAYRTVLRSVARVESSKDPRLDQAGYEDVMAVFEAQGFDKHPDGPTYWRDKVASRGERANERTVRLIEQLAASSRYCLPALITKLTAGRTAVAIELTPAEAHQLIEMLKKSNARNLDTDFDGAAAAVPFTPRQRVKDGQLALF